MWMALTPLFTRIGQYILIGGLIKIIAALGLTWYTYEGVSDMLRLAFDQISVYMDFLPIEVLQILKIMRVDEAISLICTAMLTSVFIRFGAGLLGVKS